MPRQHVRAGCGCCRSAGAISCGPVIRNFTLTLVLFIGLVGALPAHAQEDAKVDSFEAAPDQSGFTGFPGTKVPGAWGLDGTLWLDYGFHAVEGDPLGWKQRWVDHRVGATLAAQLGIMSRGAVALRLPLLLFQDDPAGLDLKTAFVGNPAIDARVRVLGAAVRPDGSVQDGAALAVRGIVSLPIPSERTLFTEDSVRAELALIGDVETFGIGAGMQLGYRYRFDDVPIGIRELRDQLRLATGVRVPMPLVARAYPGKVQEAVLIELDVATDPQGFFKRATTPIETRVSYQIHVGDVHLTAGAGAGLLAAVGSPDMRVLVGVGYSPRKHDQDADGVPDGEDQCEHLPEDQDGFQDADGCADDDNDGDLIVDEDDRCPMDAAEVGLDEDEDGCTD
jgi:OOP family OmpA-OmpF porin